jgi:hypothetical protein
MESGNPPPLKPNATVVLKPKKGKQSVLVPGADLISQDFISEAPTDIALPLAPIGSH